MIMPTRTAALILAACACLTAAPADTARMDEVVRWYVGQNQFMGSVLVARDAEVLFSNGYGFANAEWEIQNAPSTRFRLGSVTKQFTAACILLLEERGKLKTGDLVSKHLPDAPAAWEKITIHHLLTHTSGIPNFTAFPDYRTVKRSPATTEENYLRFRDKKLDFEPGEKFAYSNSNYLLLGHLLEKVAGQSYEGFLQQNVLVPLELKDTGYDSRAITPRRASGYTPAPGGMLNADYIDMTIPHAAGALYSTTGDLLRWSRGLFGGKLLCQPSLEKMTAPFRGTYAYGLDVRVANGRKVISHGGGIEGFNSHLAYYPDDRLTAVALSNLNGPATGQITSRLAAIARGEKVTLPSERRTISVAAETLAAYVGTYELMPGFEMVVTLENGQLMTQATRQQKIPVFAESETKFFPKVVEAQIEFIKDASGKVTGLVLSQGGRTIKGTRK
jgi:CubicO group peptidase (beta-lactamase class C family)